MDSAEQRLEDLRTAMYKIIDPIHEQDEELRGPPTIIQVVLFTIMGVLLNILECEFLDVEETEVE